MEELEVSALGEDEGAPDNPKLLGPAEMPHQAEKDDEEEQGQNGRKDKHGAKWPNAMLSDARHGGELYA